RRETRLCWLAGRGGKLHAEAAATAGSEAGVAQPPRAAGKPLDERRTRPEQEGVCCGVLGPGCIEVTAVERHIANACVPYLPNAVTVSGDHFPAPEQDRHLAGDCYRRIGRIGERAPLRLPGNRGIEVDISQRGGKRDPSGPAPIAAGLLLAQQRQPGGGAEAEP